jgi:ribosomal-protein-alanine N-acetyltransferase
MQVNPAIFETFPLLRTKRLLLRDIRPSDASQIFEMRSNNRVNRFIARTAMDDEQQADQLVEKTINAYRSKQGIGWAAEREENGKIIGTCGFNRIDFQNLRAEIGGELSVDYWGKRLAGEAVEAIVNFGFHTMNLHAIEARVSPGNRSAIFILDSLGFKKEAHFKDMIFFNGKFLDMAVYSLIKG